MLGLLKLAARHCPGSEGSQIVALELRVGELVEYVLIGHYPKSDSFEAEALQLQPKSQPIGQVLICPCVVEFAANGPLDGDAPCVDIMTEVQFAKYLAQKRAILWTIWHLDCEPVDLCELKIIARQLLEPARLHERETARLQELTALRVWKRMIQRKRKSKPHRQGGSRKRKLAGVPRVAADSQAEFHCDSDTSDAASNGSTTDASLEEEWKAGAHCPPMARPPPDAPGPPPPLPEGLPGQDHDVHSPP